MKTNSTTPVAISASLCRSVAYPISSTIVGGHGTDTLQQVAGKAGLIACHHDNRHGLADSPSNSQNDAGHDAGFGRGKHRREHASLMGGSQSQRSLIIALRHCPDRRFRHADDGGKNHNSQQNGGGQNAASVPPNTLRTKGTITTMPKKPYTTDGMPASRSIMGFNTL